MGALPALWLLPHLKLVTRRLWKEAEEELAVLNVTPEAWVGPLQEAPDIETPETFIA